MSLPWKEAVFVQFMIMHYEKLTSLPNDETTYYSILLITTLPNTLVFKCTKGNPYELIWVGLRVHVSFREFDCFVEKGHILFTLLAPTEAVLVQEESFKIKIKLLIASQTYFKEVIKIHLHSKKISGDLNRMIKDKNLVIWKNKRRKWRIGVKC